MDAQIWEKTNMLHWIEVRILAGGIFWSIIHALQTSAKKLKENQEKRENKLYERLNFFPFETNVMKWLKLDSTLLLRKNFQMNHQK